MDAAGLRDGYPRRVSANDDGKTPAERKKPSFTRIAIWVAAGGIGVYMVVAGVIGILSGGN